MSNHINEDREQDVLSEKTRHIRSYVAIYDGDFCMSIYMFIWHWVVPTSYSVKLHLQSTLLGPSCCWVAWIQISLLQLRSHILRQRIFCRLHGATLQCKLSNQTSKIDQWFYSMIRLTSLRATTRVLKR